MAKKKEIVQEEIVEEIIRADYSDEMSSSFMDYAVSVITDRAIPDVRDGLKPVQRRILWAMKQLGLSSSGDYKKSARVVGETMGKYHPHGDSSIYEAMVHMAQDWYFNHPLVDGHGNFGSVEGDDAAASRYTECRLSKISEDILLSDLDKETVDFVPNFDNKEKEPTVLPSVIPNILVTGTDGIAVGMASKMPTHNLGEVIDAASALLDNPNLTTDDLMEYIKGPDFATGGIIVNKSELAEIYRTGQGKIRVRGKIKAEKGDRGKINLVISEIPFTMIGAISGFMNNIAKLVHTKAMPDVTDIKNLSGKEGIRIIVELRKDADVEQNINMLYKKASLEDTFGYNATLLSKGVPSQMPLDRILREFCEFYRETQTRKYENLLAREKRAAEIREGLIAAIDVIDTIIEILRGSETVAQAKACMMKGETDGIKFRTAECKKIASKLHFTELQTDAILEMKMQKLIGLELNVIVKELETCRKNIETYTGYLSSKAKLNKKLKQGLAEIKEKYAVPRKTVILDEEAVVLKKPEMKEEKVYALVNRFGYIKLIDDATMERNRENVPKDYRYVMEVMNTGRMYVFTENGKCHQIKAKDVPMGRYNDKGVPLEQVSALSTKENHVCVVADYKPKEKLLFATAGGAVKKVLISEFDTTRRTTDATKLTAGDSVAAVIPITGKGNIVLITEGGFIVAFETGSIGVLKKNSVGVTGIKLNKGDKVIFACETDENGCFTFDEKEYKLSELDCGKRATRGKPLHP
ncbi:MAG: DNA topoisomerase 4 subunit A [Clostridia bacterium]|nr:DNA topoisomerase 4 subunit A [Clostridia bacterium]